MALPVGLALGGPGEVFDLRNRPTGSSFTYYTDMAGGQRGVPVTTGDFNGDGFLDIAASPFSGSTLGRTANGVLRITFGDGTIGAEVDWNTYTGPQLTVHGAETHSLFGVEAYVADFDIDGFDDILVGASHGKFIADAPRAGEAVILFGAPDWGASVRTLDIKSLPSSQRAKFFIGQRENDRLGSWFQIDDLDGDGELDAIMGMDLSDGLANNRTNAGAAVIAWSAGSSFPDRPYIRVGDAETAQALTVIYGRDAADLFGATSFSADLDGDGRRDAIISAGVNRSGLAYGANGYPGSGGGDGPEGTRFNAGEATIFWDAAKLKDFRALDLASLPVEIETTIIYGETRDDYFGEELFAGDFTGDGVDDLFVGALLAKRPPPVSTVGAAYMFPGGAALRNSVAIDVASPPAGFVSGIYGTESLGIAGDTFELFDINKDGALDLFYAVPQGNPSSNRLQSGYAMVIYGGQALPKMPTRVFVDPVNTTPELMRALVYGVDGKPEQLDGDLFAYSSAFGDMNGDGVLDYVPNAMLGDGKNNGFVNAGENYVADGLMISRHAAAPLNRRGLGNTGAMGPVAAWNASQPIFGEVTGYEVTFLPLGGAGNVLVTVPGTSANVEDFPGNGNILNVRAVMQRGAEIERSIVVPFSPPVEIRGFPTATPTMSPTASPTPTGTGTPTTTTLTLTATPTLTLTPTPSPSATASPSATLVPGDVVPALLGVDSGTLALDNNGDLILDAADIRRND